MPPQHHRNTTQSFLIREFVAKFLTVKKFGHDFPFAPNVQEVSIYNHLVIH